MSEPSAEPARLLDLAVDVARAAGELLLRGQQEPVSATGTKSSPTDVVTEMDGAAERLIAERLGAARPDDGLLAEEGATRPARSGICWVVDPLDGTVNYLYGLPNWAVSIAAAEVAESGEPRALAAVVHAPALARTYTAARGGGSWRDGQRLSGSSRTDLAQALVATGFGYAADRRAAQAQVLTRVLPRVRDIRRMGSAALDLCAAAEGMMDAFYERGLNPWDLAAGRLVAEEAGLRVAGLDAAAPGPDLVIAAPPALFGQLHNLLSEPPRADRD